jgi:hypothetical protein
MNNGIFIFLVLVVLLSVVFGVAHALDRRGRNSSKVPEQPGGPISRVVRWGLYGIVCTIILSLVGAFAMREMFFVKLAGNLIFLYIFVGILHRVTKTKGI